MNVRPRAYGELGFAYLVASVEAVLADAKAAGRELGPKDIGDLAGIPENTTKNQEIATGILHCLEDKGRVVHHLDKHVWVQP